MRNINLLVESIRQRLINECSSTAVDAQPHMKGKLMIVSDIYATFLNLILESTCARANIWLNTSQNFDLDPLFSTVPREDDCWEIT